MELVAVELHRDLFVLPDGIDLLVGDPDVHGGRAEAGVAAQARKAPLELRAGEAGVAVVERSASTRDRDARHRVRRFSARRSNTP